MIIHTDGAARGNPGPAAFAFVVYRDGQAPLEQAGLLGRSTNNIAEYTALVRALEFAKGQKSQRLLIKSDSELLVKQMSGHYRVKNAHLRDLYEEAKDLCRHFDQVEIRHVSRAQNSEADRLCNEVLDGIRDSGTTATQVQGGANETEQCLRLAHGEIMACLEDAAKNWARGGTEELRAEDVWSELEDILMARGLLHQRIESAGKDEGA
jgi:ribonuclease HI